MRNQNPLSPDIFQTIDLHLLEDPVYGPLEAAGSTETVPKPIHQLAQASVGCTVPGCSMNETVSYATIRSEPGSRLRESLAEYRHRQNEGDDDGTGNTQCSHDHVR
jgi:hypothetical protein